MSERSQPMRALLGPALHTRNDFPLTQTKQCANQVSGSEVTTIYEEWWKKLVGLDHPSSYREVAVLLFLGLTVGEKNMVERGLSFIRCLLGSKLMMLTFDSLGQFSLHTVLLFLQPPLELFVVRCLQQNQHLSLLSTLEKNHKMYGINRVSFQLEYIIVRKVQSHLVPDSQYQFTEALVRAVGQHKVKMLDNPVHNCLVFQETALLRQNIESPQTYGLQPVGMGMLAKVKDKHSPLPSWVVEAFSFPNRQINFKHYHSRKVLDVFRLLMYSEVFGSSPMIEEVGSLLDHEDFQGLFEKYLLGYDLAEGQYEFTWQETQRKIREIKESLSQQCYLPVLAESIREMAHPQ